MNLKNQESDAVIIDFQKYWKTLVRRKWTIFFITVLCVVLAFFMAKIATPIYQAKVTVKADPIQPNASASDQYIMNSMVFLFYETQYEIIESRNIAESVVKKLDLVDEYKKDLRDIHSNINETDFLSEMKSVIFGERDDKDLTLNDDNLRINLANSIQASLSVSGGKQSQIIDILYTAADPTRAANIANAIADSYIEFGLESRLGAIKDTSKWLSAQLDDLKSTLQESEDKLALARNQSGLMDSEQQARIVNTQLSNLNSELLKAQTEMSEAEELYAQVRGLSKERGEYFSIGQVLQNQTIRDLVRDESSAKQRFDELSKRYGPKHPKLISAQSDLAAAESTLSREVDKIVENISKEYALAKLKVANIQKLLNETKNELQSLQTSGFEIARLEREVENNSRIYESFLSRLMEADVSGDYDASNIRIIDRATVPIYPVQPVAAKYLIFGGLVGLFISIILVMLQEALDQSIKVPAELENITGQNALGITHYIGKKKGEVRPEQQYIQDQRSLFSEAINTIRTGVLLSNIDKPPKSILITSSKASEGKTTLAINLAASLSQLGKTLLIEVDLRKPAVAKDLDLKDVKYGLVDILAGRCQVDEAITKVQEEKQLSVIACGEIPKNPIALLNSAAFDKLVELLRARYEYIIFDSPPTLPVSDSCVLAQIADATLVAVKANATKRSMVNETLSRLERANAKIAGCVLTQASTEKMSYYGDQYYQESYYGVSR